MEKMKNECKTSTATRFIVKCDERFQVLQTKNFHQVENLRNKYLRLQQISHDSLYSIYELAIDLPEFVRKIETHPDLLCICGHNELMDKFDHVLTLDFDFQQLISYDITFKLGNFYVCFSFSTHTLQLIPYDTCYLFDS